MFISDEKKFIFIHVPKTAGTSIHISFKNIFAVSDRSDPPPDLHHLKISSLEDKKDYFSFAVVRNPFDRFLSGYRDFTQNKFSGVFDRDARVDYHLSTPEGQSFEDFCKAFVDSEWSKDIHFAPQNEFICINDKVAINKVVRFEQIDADLKEVYDHLDLNFEAFKGAGKARATVKNHEDYRKEYSDHTKKIIENFYQKDLELFKYSF
jgi:hypothetical protein